MNRTALRIISVLAVLFLGSVWLFGQAETGSISGTVTDSSNAVVAGAKVTLVSVGTGQTRTATTGSAGDYAITNLKAENYTLTIEHTGFQKYSRQIKVDIGSRMEVSAQLSVTGVSTTVEVTASGETAAVNTETQTLSTVVTSQQIADLPTLTRNPYDLVATSGNVSDADTDNRGAGFAINGQRSASTDILLDGGENVDLYTATVGQSVPLDSVQEFSVLTSNFDAQYGRASGGIVNVSTKSGTNQFHGSLYEFNRVSALAANTYWNNSARYNAYQDGTCVAGQPCNVGTFGFTRNQFGYSIGGPIIKNKLFFFSSTEWTRVRSNSTQDYAIVDPAFLALPTCPAGTTGNCIAANTQSFFSTYGSSLRPLTVLQHVNYAKATGQKVPASGICSNGLACNAPFAEEVNYNVPADAGGGSPQNTYSTVDRVDWNINANNTLWGRYALYSENLFSGTVNNSPYVGYDTGQTQFNQNVIINYTHLFGPSLVNSLKLNYNRLTLKQPLGANAVGPTLYQNPNNAPNLAGTGAPFIFPGYSAATPGNAIPFGGPQNLYQIYDDLSWSKGRHQLKFGGAYVQTRDNRIFGAYEEAVEALGNSGTSGLPRLVTGTLSQFQVAVYPQGQYPCSKNEPGQYVVNSSCLMKTPIGAPSFGRNNRYNDGAFYVQDSWKATSRLTVNLGIRWEYYGVQHNAPDPKLDSNFYFGPGTNIFDSIRNGGVQVAPNSPVGGLWAKDLNNWAPRVGIAWDVFGNGTLSFRGGYGISYERNFGNVTFNVIQNPPNYAVLGLTRSDGNLVIDNNNYGPLAGLGATCGQAASVPAGSSCLPNTTLRAVDPHIKTAYANFWSAAIDYQVLKSSVLSLQYTGSHGVHEYSISNINKGGACLYSPSPIASNCTGVNYSDYIGGMGNLYLGDPNGNNRLNYQYGNINFRGSDGYNLYDAFNVKFQTNNLFNKGLYLNVAYTWSHAIDNLSNTFSDGTNGNAGGLGYLDPFNPGLDKGNSEYDIRNRFVISGTWNVPWGNNLANAVERQILGGWSVSPIYSIRTGAPYSIYDCTWALYVCPRWQATAPVQVKGGNHPVYAGSTDLYDWLPLPLDNGAAWYSIAGYAAGNGAAIEQPQCTGLYHSGCTYSLGGYREPQRNSFAGPSNQQFNMVISKNFKLTERFNMQFRGELYNVFNYHNWFIQTSSADVSSGITAVQASKGGYGNSTDERRNVQFGLKLNF